MKNILHKLLLQNWKPKLASLFLAAAIWFLINDHLKRNPFNKMPDDWFLNRQDMTA